MIIFSKSCSKLQLCPSHIQLIFRLTFVHHNCEDSTAIYISNEQTNKAPFLTTSHDEYHYNSARESSITLTLTTAQYLTNSCSFTIC